MAADLRVSLGAVGALVTGYGLTVAVVSLPAAHVTRSVPRRYLLAGLLGLLAVASWASALRTVSYELLLAARVVTALAQASFWVLMGPVAVGLFPPERRGRVMGLLSVGGSLATVLGVPAGTWLGGHGGWRAPFVVLGALALVSSSSSPACSRPPVPRRVTRRTVPPRTGAGSSSSSPPPPCR